MTSIAESLAVRAKSNDKIKTLSFPVALVLVYLVMEYARPANPLFIPMAISIILFAKWTLLSQKRWEPQIVCFIALLGAIAVMVPFATNNFSAFLGLRTMAVQLICIAVPMMHFVDTLPRLALVTNTMVGIFTYLGMFAILLGGRGPGGHVGDENDVAIVLITFMPLAIVSAMAAKSQMQKVLFGGAFAIMCAGVVASMSRGGFLGFAAMLGYGFWLSPNKMQIAVIGLVLVVGLALLAPAEYWDEVASIGYEIENEDMNAGTGAMRRVYWGIARQMFYANPFFGVGIGNFSWSAGDYQGSKIEEEAERLFTGQEVHSLYFQVLSELGLAGVVLFALILWFNRRDLREVYASVNHLLRLAKNKLPGRFGALNGLSTEKVAQQDEWPNSKMGHSGWTSVPDNGLDRNAVRDIEHLLYYSRAIEAGLIGFLVSGMFISVFTYPHFWVLTALIISLKHITRDQMRQLQEAKILPGPSTGRMSFGRRERHMHHDPRKASVPANQERRS